MGCDLPAEPQMEFVRKALGFLEDGQISCPSFLYTGVVQKRQKFFCNSVKRQKFTQRIATVVVLCYNEQRRRMNRA